jgi:ketosteroid isomerase-like protein
MLQTTRIFAIVFFAVLSFSGKNYAQQWSAEQKEVWAGVQKYWEIDNNNPQAYFKYFDDSYLGWSYANETPGTKEDAVKSSKYTSTKVKQAYNIITPARIWVSGDFAYVHYYYTQVTESNDGKSTTEKGRWTDILMKKNGTWMIVGDHGGEIKHED